MSKHLEIEIKNLKLELLALTKLVEINFQKSILSLEKKDNELANEVIKADQEIDRKEVEIEEECLKILALHQPVAVDLRYIVCIIKMNNELERIGDLAVNIAQRAQVLIKCSAIKIPFDFKEMADKSYCMLERSIHSFVEVNKNIATQVCIDDQEIDNLNKQMYKTMFKKIKDNPEETKQLMQYVSVSRYLERLADMATNIAEDVLYMIDGIIHRHHPEVSEE